MTDSGYWALFADPIASKGRELSVALAPTVEWTGVYGPLHATCDALKLREDEVLAIFVLFYGVFACTPLPWIRDPFWRKAYGTSMGLFIGFYGFGVCFWNVVIYVMTGWSLMRFLPPRIAGQVTMAFAACGLLLRQYHTYQQGGFPGFTDIKCLMLIAIKLATIASNYKDAVAIAQKEDKLMTPRERLYAEPLVQQPTMFEWINFFFFAGTVSFGMPLEYKKFDDFINLRGDYGKMRPGSQLMPTLKRTGHGFLCLAFMQIMKKRFEPETLLLDSFQTEPLWWKMVAVVGSSHVRIYTMFLGFIFSECNLIACGHGYSVVDGKEEFNSFRQVECWKFETTTDALECTMMWNIQVHHWLKYYVSLKLKDRTRPRGELQLGATFLTYMISGMWHGFDAGFYCFFVGLALLDVFDRLIQRSKLAHFVQGIVPWMVLYPFCWIWHMVSLTYLGTAFVLLSYSKFDQVHYALGHYLHYVLVLGIPLAMLLPKKSRSKDAAKPGDKKQTKVE